MSIIKKINITAKSEADTFYIEEAYLESNAGIVGDRYYNNYEKPSDQISLIEQEIIEDFEKKINQKIEHKDFRRNVITEGIPLTKLINKKIQIGNEVVLKIHEICEPCNYLQKKLKIDSLVKLLVNKSGVKAEIITSGKIKINDKLIILD